MRFEVENNVRQLCQGEEIKVFSFSWFETTHGITECLLTHPGVT